MKQAFDAAVATDLKRRILSLRPDSARQWGTMTVAQAIAHCCGGFEMANGDRIPPRMILGRIIGWIIKPLALGGDTPMRRNTPTVHELVVRDERNLETERQRLCALLDRFVSAGPQGCSTHPHSFFGRLAPEEWATLMYKHLDHHLRQFGA